MESSVASLRSGTPTFPRLPLKVALAATYHHSGEPHRGVSYEYNNFFLTMKELFDAAELFDFHALMTEHGREKMNRELLSFVRREKPDLIVFPLFKDEFIPEIIDEVSEHTTTVCYFFDDDWRVDWSEAWAPHFHYITTPQTCTVRTWHEKGYGDRVIYSPFAFNHYTYVRRPLTKIHDVSFVGGYHPYRAWIVKRLRKAGFDVKVWGNAWPGGVVSVDDMVKVFNQSKINLNLSDSVSWDARYLVSGRRPIRNLFRSQKRKEQVKARHFEINGCGGFQASYYTEDLEHCFEIGRELVIYMQPEDLVEKVGYYLRYDDEREEIARAGHGRALADHTCAKRFVDMVEHIDSYGWRPPTGRPAAD